MNSFGEAKGYDWKVTVFLQWKHHFPQEQFSHDALLNDTIKAPLPNSSEDKLPKSNLAYASFERNGTDVWCGIGDQTKLVPPHSCRICLGGGSTFSAAQALSSSRTVVWCSSEWQSKSPPPNLYKRTSSESFNGVEPTVKACCKTAVPMEWSAHHESNPWPWPPFLFPHELISSFQ